MVVLLTNNSCINSSKVKDFSIGSPIEWGISTLRDTINLTTTYCNLSSKAVLIDYIDTPCGCITAIPRDFYVGGGDSTVIDIAYKPLDFGYIEQNLFMYLKNRKVPIHIVIRGRVKNNTN